MLNYLRYLKIAPISSFITAALFLSFLLLAVMDVVGVYLLGQLISIIVQGTGESSFVIDFFKSLNINLPRNIIIIFSCLIALYFIFKAIAAYFIQTRLLEVSYSVMIKMRVFLMKKYLNLNYLDIILLGFSKIATKINLHCDTYVRGIYMPIMRLISDSIMLLLLGLFLFSQNPVVFPIFLFLITFFIGGYIIIIKNKIYSAGKEAALAQETFLLDIKNSVRGIKESKILAKESYYLDKFSRNTHYLAENIKLHDKFVILPKYFIEAVLVSVMVMLVVLSIWFYGYQNNQAYVMIGYYIAAALRIMPSINQTVTSIGNMRNATYIVEELKKEFQDTASNTEKTDIAGFDKSIIFDKVSFSYPESDKRVLNDLNICINKFDNVGIIGESGSGKTTFLDILIGLISPTEGSLIVDNEIIANKNNDSWMKNISFISQDISLFNESIKQNIILDENIVDEEKLKESLTKSGLSKELSKFINGVDTVIGDEGSFLSGGQRQRVGIARAIYHSRDIMVLDEATTGLDTKLEEEIIQSVYDLCKDKTLFIISHNHKILSRCNKILQIKDGKIKELELNS
jgi:ABC-type multidrug transport system fused ATPase/permease subunit